MDQRIKKSVIALCALIYQIRLSAHPWEDIQQRFKSGFDARQTNISIDKLRLNKSYLVPLKGIGSPGDLLKQIQTQVQDISQQLQVQSGVVKGGGFGLHAGDRYSQDFSFALGNIPLCFGQIRVHKLARFEQPIVMGQVPELEFVDLDSMEWPQEADVMELAFSAMIDQGLDLYEVKTQKVEQCFWVAHQQAIPAYQFAFQVNGLPYRVIASLDEVYLLEPRFFDLAMGSAQAYDPNPLGSLKTYTLDNLVGNGKLEDQYFFTYNPSSQAQEEDHQFIYDPSDSRFDEVSVFVHAREQYEFFKSLGHEWKGPKLKIVPHAVIGGTSDNALYTPAASENDSPMIQIADGSGVVLKNLGKDADVVSHELGHHIIYDTLKSVSGQSLVLHEGLADYFAFAHTNDPCLGESICPAGSPINCEIDAQCLRTGDNNYVLGKNTKSEPHFKSQFVSGMLWSLRDHEIPAADLDKLVFRSVQFLLQNSGYYDWILSLMLADKELYQGKYCGVLYSRAQERGLGDYMSGLDCNSELPTLVGSEVSQSNDEPSSRSKKSYWDKLTCGVVVGGQGDHQAGVFSWVWLALLFLPIIVILAVRNIEVQKRSCYPVRLVQRYRNQGRSLRS